jgi:hypothetical protein
MTPTKLVPKTGRFQKGHRKLGGRRKGTPNRLTRAVKAFLAELCDSPAVQEAVQARVLKGDTVAFFRALEHVVGKPRQAVEVNQDSRVVYSWAGELRTRLEDGGRKRLADARRGSEGA